MADGYTELLAMIAKLRKLGHAPEEIAGDIAPALRAQLTENVAAATDAYGQPWQPTLDGHLPLRGAPAGLGVAAVGTRVLAALRGIYARHHYGRVRGGIARPILPGSELPLKLIALINEVAVRRFRLIMGGA